jgi:hypothetical protein
MAEPWSLLLSHAQGLELHGGFEEFHLNLKKALEESND